MQVELADGVTEVARKSGSVYRATSGSGEDRIQYTFATPELATKWKTESDLRHAAGHRRRTKEEFLAAPDSAPDTDGVVPASFRLHHITLDAMLDETLTLLKKQVKVEKGKESKHKVLRRFFEDQGVDAKIHPDWIDAKVAHLLPEWLHQENYDRSTQGAYLGHAQQVWELAQGCRYVSGNPFAGLEPTRKDLPRLRRDGSDRKLPPAPPWTPSELVAIASLLRPSYVGPFWAGVAMGDRLSEGFGLLIRDVYGRSRIGIDKQRQGSAAAGTTSPKSPAGNREIPVFGVVAALFDDYIDDVHGECPDDPAAREAWLDRYLFVGVKGGPMNPSSLGENIKSACQTLGLTPDVVGRYDPVHHLRKTLGQLMQRPDSGLNRKAVQSYLGHENGLANDVTERSYNPLDDSDLLEVGRFVARWFRSEILPLVGGSDLMRLRPFDDGITLTEAARRLTLPDEPFDIQDVLALVQAGQIRISKLNFTSDEERQAPLVSAAEIDQLLADRLRARSDSLPSTEVARLLHTDTRRLARAAEAEGISPVEDTSSRRSRYGNRGGALPGGGTRYSRTDVDRLTKVFAERIRLMQTCMTIGEGAAYCGISEDRMRALADAPDSMIVSWRDELDRRRTRYLCPDSVRAYARNADVTHADAADLIDDTTRKVAALVKLGDLTAGTGYRTVTRASLDAYLRGGSSSDAA